MQFYSFINHLYTSGIADSFFVLSLRANASYISLSNKYSPIPSSAILLARVNRRPISHRDSSYKMPYCYYYINIYWVSMFT